MSSAEDLINQLQLLPHPEGGYFRRIYTSSIEVPVGSGGSRRKLLSSIYYLLTRDSPVGHLHVNRSDIVHYFLRGSPLTYTLVSPEGELSRTTLGPDISSGHNLHLVVPSGWWKASELASGEYGLVSEAVSPGFEYEDMRFVSRSELPQRLSSDAQALERFCRD